MPDCLNLIDMVRRVFIALIAISLFCGCNQIVSTAKAEPSRSVLSHSELLEAERLLSKLGYWMGPADGYIDEATRYATLCFQRVAGLSPTGTLTKLELRTLRRAVPIIPRSTGQFHVEVNLSKQILFVVQHDGTISHLLPVNTGSGKKFTQGGWTRRALTPVGTFAVYRKIDGWRQSPLGSMYYPSYIYGGIAIHGSQDIPKFPSTHGCIAVPLFAAETLSNFLALNTTVIVYKDPPETRLRR